MQIHHRIFICMSTAFNSIVFTDTLRFSLFCQALLIFLSVRKDHYRNALSLLLLLFLRLHLQSIKQLLTKPYQETRGSVKAGCKIGLSTTQTHTCHLKYL